MGKRTTGEVLETCARRRWTENDARCVLNAWREAVAENGESIASFCRRMGLVPMRLHRWRHRMEDSGRRPGLKAGTASPDGRIAMARLVPVTVHGTATASSNAEAAVVVVSSGVRIEVHDPTAAPPAWVSTLVRMLAGPRP